VLDVGRTASGLPYLVLEHMEGSDLGCYVERRGRLPVSEAVDCVLQACEALAEAHAFGIVHRDLKPENLFLCEEADGGFVVKVLDFGVSKAPPGRRGGRSLTNPFEVVGSPTYMAPEQIRGGQVDARTDIWALGVLLHELISGDLPFASATVTDTFSMILDEAYALPPLEAGPAADEVSKIIQKCMQRCPDDRYQDVVELAAALAPFGVDPLQARRVAKVAAASRARMIATDEQPTLATPGTPWAISTPTLQSKIDQLPSSPRASLATWLAGSALGVAVGIGCILLLASQHPAPAAGSRSPSGLVSEIDMSKAAIAAPIAQETEAAFAATRPAAGSASTSASRDSARTHAAPNLRPGSVRWPLASNVQRSATGSSAPSLAAAEPAVTVSTASEPAPEAPVAGLTTTPVEVAPPAVSSSADAWDPKTFGGRR
jgi:eukaryotic-like serine/threonine-protein kinase